MWDKDVIEKQSAKLKSQCKARKETRERMKKIESIKPHRKAIIREMALHYTVDEMEKRLIEDRDTILLILMEGE